MVTITAATAFRDYQIDGDPGSGIHNPVKNDIRVWGGEIEAREFDALADIAAATVPAAIKTSRTKAFANPTDLGGGIYARATAEPTHSAKVRSLDRFLPNGSQDAGNGGWWELMPERGGASFEQLGAVGDGVADDTAALIGVRDFLAAKINDGTLGRGVMRGTAGRVYSYTNNRWAYGIGDLVVEGNGCSFRNDYNGAVLQAENLILLNTWNWYIDHGDNASTGTQATLNVHYGHYIQDVSAGATVVNFVTAGDSSNYSAGEWVLVAGYAQQRSGQPPNYRFYEYRKIQSVASGTLTLTEKLRYSYDREWPDSYLGVGVGGQQIGKPIVLRLGRTNRKLTRRLEIRDVTFLDSTTNPADKARAQFNGILDIRLINVDTTATVQTIVSECRSFYAEDCKFSDVKGDKTTGEMKFVNCVAAGLSECTGVERVTWEGGRLHKGKVQLGPRQMAFRDCEFDNNTTTGGAVLEPRAQGAFLTHSAIFQNVRVTGNPGVPLWKFSFLHSEYTIATLGTADEIIIDPTVTAQLDAVRAVNVGTVLVNDAGTLMGKVTSMTGYGVDPTKLAIAVDWRIGTPAVSNVVKFTTCKVLKVDSISGLGRNRPSVQVDNEDIVVELNSRDIPEWNPLGNTQQYTGWLGYVTRAEMTVEKAGVATNAAGFRVRNNSAAADLVIFDMLVKGVHTATQSGVVDPATAAPTHNVAPWEAFCGSLYADAQATTGGGSSDWSGATAAERPEFSLKIYGRRLV